MELKQVILVRRDLKLSKGKTATQCAHASIEAVLRSKDNVVEKWRREGMKKVVLKVENETKLLDYDYKAKRLDLTTALITDAGRTEIPSGTITCLAIGPDEEGKIDKITGKLKML